MRRENAQVSAARGYSARAMKSLRFLPLTFLAGVHGFALFAPYAALATAAMLLFRKRRRRTRALVTAAVPLVARV
jgi:hypothetical protein